MKSDKQTSDVLQWLCRDFRSTEFWKATARKHFLSVVSLFRLTEADIVDGKPNPRDPEKDAKEISEQSLRSLTQFLKDVFEFMPPVAGNANIWNDDFTSTQKLDSPPPKITDEINWEYIADYFLMCVTDSSDELIALNSVRKEFNVKITGRTQSNVKRLEVFFNVVQKYLVDSIMVLKPGDKKEEAEVKQLKNRPKLIEEETIKGESREILLPDVLSYRTKHF